MKLKRCVDFSLKCIESVWRSGGWGYGQKKERERDRRGWREGLTGEGQAKREVREGRQGGWRAGREREGGREGGKSRHRGHFYKSAPMAVYF